MIEKKGLGKGLSALIPVREDFANKREDVVYLNVEQIQPNPYQPREDFNSGELEELVASIKEKGIIQPVLVRRSPNGYELIAGERRLRAAKELNIKEIPAIIKDVKNEESLEIALIENIQRQNLNPIEEAHAFKHLIDQFEFTQDKIAQAVGKARVSVSNILRLLKLPSEIQLMLRKGELSFAHGKVLLEVQEPQKQLFFAHQCISKGLSVKELGNLILPKEKKGPTRQHAHQLIPQLKAVEEELRQALGTKVKIIHGRKGGYIHIDYYSQDDLERIYKVITK